VSVNLHDRRRAVLVAPELLARWVGTPSVRVGRQTRDETWAEWRERIAVGTARAQLARMTDRQLDELGDLVVDLYDSGRGPGGLRGDAAFFLADMLVDLFPGGRS
jgi:hypothetical protein